MKVTLVFIFIQSFVTSSVKGQLWKQQGGVAKTKTHTARLLIPKYPKHRAFVKVCGLDNILCTQSRKYLENLYLLNIRIVGP